MSFLRRFAGPALLLTAAASCELAVGPGEDVLLVITNIDAPAEVAPEASFDVIFTVQSGGCVRFDALVVSQSRQQLNVSARGRDSSGSDVNCPGDIRETNQTVRVRPPLDDPFTILARQPNGPSTTRVVRVR